MIGPGRPASGSLRFQALPEKILKQSGKRKNINESAGHELKNRKFNQ